MGGHIPDHPHDPYELLLEIKRELGDISRTLGRESEDGKGGTGLVGQVKSHGERLNAYDRMKWIALGMVAFVGAFSSAVREAVASFFMGP